jgi:hypothetical protein
MANRVTGYGKAMHGLLWRKNEAGKGGEKKREKKDTKNPENNNNRA